jgi:hypothetical protein
MSPPIAVNFDDVEAWSGGIILNPGTHVVKCVKAEEGTSSGGHDQIELEFEAIAGEEVGATIRDWQVVTPESRGRVLQILKAFGAKIPKGDWNLDAKQLVGKTCKIVVRKEPKRDGSGDEVSVVKAYQPVGDGDAAVQGVKDAFPGATESKGGGDEDLPF